MKPRVAWTGNKEIDAVFRGLPNQLQDKVLQDAHARSLKITIDRAKLIAPEGPTGNLIDSLGIIKERGKGKTELGLVRGGPRRGGKNKGYHAHLIEYGFKTRLKSGKHGSKSFVQPDPFMEPAWIQTRGRVTDSIAVNIGRKLVNFIRRTVKK